MDTKSKINYYNRGIKSVALLIALIGAMIITGVYAQVNSLESIMAFTNSNEAGGRSLLEKEVNEFRNTIENIQYYEEEEVYSDIYNSRDLEYYKGLKEEYLQKGYIYYYVNQEGDILSYDSAVKPVNIQSLEAEYFLYPSWNEVELNGELATLKVAAPKTLLVEKISLAKEISELGKHNLIAIVIGLLLLLSGGIYLINTAGKSFKEQEVELKGIDKIYSDVLLLMVGLGDIGMIGLGIMAYENLADSNLGRLMKLTIFALGFIFFIVNAFTILNIAKKIKAKKFLKQSLMWTVISKLGEPIIRIGINKPKAYISQVVLTLKELSNKSIYRSMMSWAMMTMGLIIAVILLSLPFGFIPAIVGLPLVGMIMLKKITDKTAEFIEIAKGVSEIRKGNYSYKINKLEIAELDHVAEDINNIAEGMDNAIKKAVKAEKLKSELITNVSHDLKTPLTSIIGYVELLEDMELPEEAKSYVKIVSQKSDRLKHIIQDLFDLTKTTSGDIELEIEELDLLMLIHQTLGEMEVEIENSGKTLKLNTKLETARIKGDGKRLYRVLQNLLDNSLKYSMVGTRIFIDLKKEEDKTIFEIKNTASYEMDFTEEEILQRFTRGDKNRTTEGNGLGLSIAQGFTLAQGGSFEIKIDGDQFKVILTFKEN